VSLAETAETDAAEPAEAETEPSADEAADTGGLPSSGEPSPRRRRRGKRGGRRRNRRDELPAAPLEGGADGPDDGEVTEPALVDEATDALQIDSQPTEAPMAESKPKRSRSRKKVTAAESEGAAAEPTEPVEEEKPKRRRAPRKTAPSVVEASEAASDRAAIEVVAAQPEAPLPEPSAVESPAAPVAIEQPAAANEEPPAAPRKGWWNRFLKSPE